LERQQGVQRKCMRKQRSFLRNRTNSIFVKEVKVKKCYCCPWYSDKCKNPNSRNKDKFPEDIKQCRQMLINKNIKPK